MFKNFFLNIILLKEKVFSLTLPKYKFLFLAILFLGLVWPVSQAQAVFEGLAELIANAVFQFIFLIIVGIGNLILQLSLLVLNWILSENFMPWSYTNAATNPIISIGWTLTRDLANMSFIVILVAIGLGTALKLGEYQVQKTLPTLIVIALLINFTPVLLGLMIDASNITMNFFLEKVSGLDAMGRIFEAQSSLISQTFRAGGVVTGSISAIFQIMMLFVIDIFSAAIIAAFAALFLIRYIAIWILVILSPIVFALYILPNTRKMYWNQWWHQFTQWTIIGIPAAFFLYLGNHIMISAPTMDMNPPSGGIWDVTFITFIKSVMPYFISLIFLWFGFFTALSSSAQGSSGIIKTVQAGVKKLPNTRRAQLAKSKLAGAGLATVGGAARVAKRLDQGAAKMGIFGRGLQIATKPTAWATRAASGAAIPALSGYAATQRKTPIPKQWDSMSTRDKELYVSAQGVSQDRLVLASKMAAEKSFSNTSKSFKEKMLSDAQRQAGNAHLKKEVEEIVNLFPDKITEKMMIDLELSTIPSNQRTAKRQEIETKLRTMAQEYGFVDYTFVGPDGKETRVKATDQAAQVLRIQGFKPENIEKISKESINTRAFRIASQSMGANHFQKLMDIHGRDVIEGVMNGTRGLNTIINSKDDLENFYLKNPGLVNFFATNPAGQALNWSGLTYANTEAKYKQLKSKMRIIRKFTDPTDRNLALEYSRRLERETEVDQEINYLRTNNPTSSDIGLLETEKTRITQDLKDNETKINASTNPELKRIKIDLENIKNVSASKPPAHSTQSISETDRAELTEIYNILTERLSPYAGTGRSKEVWKNVRKAYTSGDLKSLRDTLRKTPPTAPRP